MTFPRFFALILTTTFFLPVQAQPTTTPTAPTITPPTAVMKAPKSKKSTTITVNINSATINELQQVKGIGVATAKKIIAGRPYKTIDDLMTNKIISAKQYTTLKPQLSL